MSDTSAPGLPGDGVGGGVDPLTPPFTTKVALLVRDDLETWQRLNVTAFLVSGITAAHPELVGQPYRDGEGQVYLSLLGVPVLVFAGTAEALRASRQRALQRGIPLAVYTREMFGTGHDADNRAAVAGVRGEDLDLVGLALHGPKNAVDKVLKGSRLHP